MKKFLTYVYQVGRGKRAERKLLTFALFFSINLVLYIIFNVKPNLFSFTSVITYILSWLGSVSFFYFRDLRRF